MYDLDYTEENLDRLIEGVYNGTITARLLPKKLYLAIGAHLEKAIYKGYGANILEFEFGSVDYELLTQLRENIYIFSGAKTFHLTKGMQDINNALLKGDKVATFKEFEESARDIFKTYNKTWLETEYTTAIGQARSAQQWNEIEADKKLFTHLRYNAVEDKNTSEICRPLDGITLPVDHPFWNTHAPLNHFRCRCILDKIDKYEDIITTSKTTLKEVEGLIDPKMQPVFKSNPGKDKVIFSKDHPYFEIDKEYRKLARNNFNLPMP